MRTSIAASRELFADRRVSAFGYYKPSRRTLLVNLSAGAGALRHELTHAVIDFDLPQAPAWLSEGLASLHEACDVSAKPGGLAGVANWRTRALLEALRIGRLPSLHSLVWLGDLQGRDEAVRYAQARHLCLYLQRRRLLAPFYARYRQRVGQDPSGADTLLETVGGQSWPELEAAFRAWLLDQAAGEFREFAAPCES